MERMQATKPKPRVVKRERRADSPPASDNRLTISIDEAAERLGICRAYAYRKAREGNIPSIRLGRRILVPVAQLEERVRRGLL